MSRYRFYYSCNLAISENKEHFRLKGLIFFLCEETCYVWINKKVYITWFFQKSESFHGKRFIHIDHKKKASQIESFFFLVFSCFGKLGKVHSVYLSNFSYWNSFHRFGCVLNITLRILRQCFSLASKHLFNINKIRAKAILDVHGHCFYLFNIIKICLILFSLMLLFNLDENNRISLIFLCFPGDQKRTMGTKELNLFALLSIILNKMISSVKTPNSDPFYAVKLWKGFSQD